MKIQDMAIEGVKKITLSPIVDLRGSFTKIFHEGIYNDASICFDIKEEYVSISKKGVIRGMHFQVPPCDCVKLVSILSGSVIDVILDLRKASSTYLQWIDIQLNANDSTSLLIPKGCAHGFLSLENNTSMLYNVSSVYSPECDAGIRWDSFGYDWNEKNPVVSVRDQDFPTLQKFQNTF